MKQVAFICMLALLLGGCAGKNGQPVGKPYGVNMACADFGSNFPGVYNTDYTYPEASDLDYWNDHGLKLIRFPFKWERLQYELNGELNRHDLDKMKAFVTAAAERDMVVLLDLHNGVPAIGRILGHSLHRISRDRSPTACPPCRPMWVTALHKGLSRQLWTTPDRPMRNSRAKASAATH